MVLVSHSTFVCYVFWDDTAQDNWRELGRDKTCANYKLGSRLTKNSTVEITASLNTGVFDMHFIRCRGHSEPNSSSQLHVLVFDFLFV